MDWTVQSRSIKTSIAIAIALSLATSTALACLVQGLLASASALSIGIPQKMPQYAASGENLYAVWFDNDAGSSGGILFSKSTDGGTSFSNPKKILDSEDVNFPIRLAASGDNVYLVWSTWTDRPNDVFLMKSGDAGETFDPPANLSGDLISSRSPQIAVHGDNVYVAWVSEGGILGSGIILRASTNGGDDFAAAATLSSFSKMSYKQPVIAAFENNVYVAWEDLSNEQYDIVFAASIDNGKNFHKMSIDEPNTHAWSPAVSATENDAYVTYGEWLGGADPDWPTNGRVMLKRIVEGRTIDASVQISRGDSGSLGLFAEVPTVLASASSMGNSTDDVYVVWRDGISNTTQVSARISNDSGKTSGEIITLSNITWPYPAAALVSQHEEGEKKVLYMAWGNSIEYGKWDVFVAAIDENANTHTIKVSDSGLTSDPQIFSGNDSAYLFWTDGRHDAQYNDIFFARIDSESGLKSGPIIQISNRTAQMPELSSNNTNIEQSSNMTAVQQSHDSYWIMSFPFGYLIGMGAIVAGIATFFVFRKTRKA